MPPTLTLSVEMPREDVAYIFGACEERGVTVEQFMREALIEAAHR